MGISPMFGSWKQSQGFSAAKHALICHTHVTQEGSPPGASCGLAPGLPCTRTVARLARERRPAGGCPKPDLPNSEWSWQHEKQRDTRGQNKNKHQYKEHQQVGNPGNRSSPSWKHTHTHHTHTHTTHTHTPHTHTHPPTHTHTPHTTHTHTHAHQVRVSSIFQTKPQTARPAPSGKASSAASMGKSERMGIEHTEGWVQNETCRDPKKWAHDPCAWAYIYIYVYNNMSPLYEVHGHYRMSLM